jgi:hypothetical protein
LAHVFQGAAGAFHQGRQAAGRQVIAGAAVGPGIGGGRLGQPATLFGGGHGGAAGRIVTETLREEHFQGDGEGIEALTTAKRTGLEEILVQAGRGEEAVERLEDRTETALSKWRVGMAEKRGKHRGPPRPGLMIALSAKHTNLYLHHKHLRLNQCHST